ncbi:MAG: Cation/H+ exchanger [Candidatus Syntrophoarchaeum caldarius]|uniref:Cation/H+ exchanger n=1 Tax=Candidatus Syntropharchaeum caldarium TaxID=1838285 RepID=A0A1F2P7W1_9EURY|nr:MAG: Cation/H+ exchanger [Candidatus Syntrophoarchaeum caldarius]
MSVYLPLFTIAVLAFVIPILSERIGIPAVVGEIVCGIIIGGSVLGIITGAEEGIAFLSRFGFVFLMFLIGLEIDFSTIELHGLKSVVIGISIFILTFATSIVMMDQIGYGIYPAIILSCSAVGLIASTLRETGMVRTEYGQMITITAFIADFAVILLVTAYTLDLRGEIAGKKVFIPLLFILFFGVYYLGRYLIWQFPERLSKLFKSDHPSEIGVRSAFALLLIFVVLSEALGAEAVLGAFLAGVMLSSLFGGGTVLEQKLYGIGYGFLIPIFFINVGIGFNLGALGAGEGLYLIPVLFAIAIIAKVIPSLILLKEYTLKESIAAGILLSSRLSMIIAVAAVGCELGLIDAKLESAIVILAMMTSIICPTIFKWMHQEKSHS